MNRLVACIFALGIAVCHVPMLMPEIALTRSGQRAGFALHWSYHVTNWSNRVVEVIGSYSGCARDVFILEPGASRVVDAKSCLMTSLQPNQVMDGIGGRIAGTPYSSLGQRTHTNFHIIGPAQQYVGTYQMAAGIIDRNNMVKIAAGAPRPADVPETQRTYAPASLKFRGSSGSQTSYILANATPFEVQVDFIGSDRNIPPRIMLPGQHLNVVALAGGKHTLDYFRVSVIGPKPELFEVPRPYWPRFGKTKTNVTISISNFERTINAPSALEFYTRYESPSRIVYLIAPATWNFAELDVVQLDQ